MFAFFKNVSNTYISIPIRVASVRTLEKQHLRSSPGYLCAHCSRPCGAHGVRPGENPNNQPPSIGTYPCGKMSMHPYVSPHCVNPSAPSFMTALVYLIPGWGAYVQRTLPHVDTPFLVRASEENSASTGFTAVTIHKQLVLVQGDPTPQINGAWFNLLLRGKTMIITRAKWALAQHMAAENVNPDVIAAACF